MWNASLTQNLSVLVQLKYKTQQNYSANKDHNSTTAYIWFVSTLLNLNDQI